MRDGRVARMIRELRSEPATQWFERLFGPVEPAAAAVALPQLLLPPPPTAPAPPAVEEGSEIESWLM